MDDRMIRDATDDDLGALRDVFRRASLSNDGDRAMLLANPGFLVWDPAPSMTTRVALLDDRIVGFASTSPGDGAVELDDLFVDPDVRRRGIARLLIADAARSGAAAGAPAIEVTGNSHALAFYEAVGFVVIGTASTEGAVAPRLRLDLAGLASPG
jgi:GNAT superfamily N-acetyltransferase